MPESSSPGRRWVEIGHGVFRRRYPAFDQGICAIVGDGQVLVADTRSTADHARELLEDLRWLTPLPVRIVVNTHVHFDHTFGNAQFAGAAIWGHARCAAELLRNGEARRAAAVAWARGSGSEGSALADAVALVEIVPPPHVVGDDGGIIEVGGRLVELHYLGRGHTDADLVLAVPDAGVVIAGDLVEEGAPPSFEDSFPLDWPETLDRVAALVRSVTLPGGGAVVAPGHGALVDVAFVERQADDLRGIALSAREGYEAGIPEADAAARLGLPSAAARTAIRRAWAQQAARP
ncbi:MAG TPA: MBL fold metallo-hydrolase [Candidatus Acidoferrales bacterium]|nr:MBL fold metallo-hydrolase [Candidatus Acidoferrales bacterium]